MFLWSILFALILASSPNTVSGDAGASGGWASVGPSNLYIQSLTGLPGFRDSVLVGGTTLQRSDDHGISWRPSDTGIAPDSPVDVFSLLLDPASPGVIYAAGGGIFRSADGGLSWTRLESGIFCCDRQPGNIGVVYSLAVDPSRPSTLYAGTLGPWKYQAIGNSGIFKSSDGGKTWIRSVAGLPNPQMPSVWSLLIDAGRKMIYAGTDAGVFSSVDEGVTWRETAFGGLQVNVLRFDIRNPQALLAGLQNGSVSRSLDGGQTWQSLSAGLPGNPIEDLLVDPASPGVIYAATDGGGAFVSHDSGNTWSSFNEGLGDLVLTHLALDASNSYLFAGSLDRGVFVREVRPGRLPLGKARPRPLNRVVRPHAAEPFPETPRD